MLRETIRILLVDDNPSALEDLADAMDVGGWVHEGYLDGQSALAALQAARSSPDGPFDIALVDIMMPGMDGIELLRRIRAGEDDVDVIMITAYPELGTAVDALRLGAVDYVIRDVPLRQIMQTVARAVARRRVRRFIDTLAAGSRAQAGMPRPGDAVASALDHALRATGATKGLIVGRPTTGDMTVVACQGFRADEADALACRAAALPALLYPPGRLAAPVVVADTAGAAPSDMAIGDSGSLLLVPMLFEGNVEGILWIGHPQKGYFVDPVSEAPSEARYRTSDAKDFLCILAAQIAAQLAYAREVEARLAAERALAQAKLVEEQRKIDFLRACFGNVAHAAKNPLWYISARAQLLLELVQDQEVRDDLEAIDHSVGQIDELFQAVVDLAFRAEVLPNQAVELRQVLEEAVIAARTAREVPEGKTLVTALGDVPLSVKGDRLQLKNAFGNVITNALEASDEVRIEVVPDEGRVQVRVINVGGAPIKEPEKLWVPMAGCTPPRFPGEIRGFGLPIARAIMVGHGGTLDLEECVPADAGAGTPARTTFLATLPLPQDGGAS